MNGWIENTKEVKGEEERERETDSQAGWTKEGLLCMCIFALASLNSFKQIRHYISTEQSCEVAGEHTHTDTV